MSSPNMNAASILRNQSNHSNNNSVSNLSGMKTVLVGKDQQPVTIMQMAPVNESAWRKAASFDNLRNTAHSLLETHSITRSFIKPANPPFVWCIPNFVPRMSSTIEEGYQVLETDLPVHVTYLQLHNSLSLVDYCY